MRLDIHITGLGLVGSAGSTPEENWQSLRRGENNFSRESTITQSRLNSKTEASFSDLQKDKYLKLVDRVALMGITVAKQAASNHERDVIDEALVLMGTSRGSVGVLEKNLKDFQTGKNLEKYLSLATHIGSLSSSISHAMNSTGNSLTIGAACTSGLQAIGIAAILLQTGQGQSAIAGASESPLTEFTVKQLSALGVLAPSSNAPYPNRPFHPSRTGAVYGEGAAAVFLETKPTLPSLGIIRGYAAAFEKGMNPGLTENAESLYFAVSNALKFAELKPSDIDVIVGHGSGTLAGDSAENFCYQNIFGDSQPLLAFNKWSIGHFVGGAGAANAVVACMHLRDDFVPAHPYFEAEHEMGKSHSKKLRYALVTSLGMGGGANAMIIEKA